MVLPMVTPRTCPTLDAGSVLTSSTRLPGLGEAHGGRAGQRGLADAALAGEEQEPGRVGEEAHRDQPQPSGPQPHPTSSAVGAEQAQVAGPGGHDRVGGGDAGELEQLVAARVGAGGDGDAVHEGQRQAFGPGDLQERADGVVGRERGRVVGEVVPLDVDALGP